MQASLRGSFSFPTDPFLVLSLSSWSMPTPLSGKALKYSKLIQTSHIGMVSDYCILPPNNLINLTTTVCTGRHLCHVQLIMHPNCFMLRGVKYFMHASNG